MLKNRTFEGALARSITRAASNQTYHTIRFLVDRGHVEDAYRAYAYFRWVDDIVDVCSGSSIERSAFLERQKALLDGCYLGESTPNPSAQERMLIQLVQHDHEKNSGLQIYLRNMMKVMEFDVERRGRFISGAELIEYTRWLASAVTEAIHYFIGHGGFTPRDETRYLAVSAAHITHMLRDTFDDVGSGYYNIPREVLKQNHIGPQDVQSDAYQTWVKSQVQLAREYFKTGKSYFARVQSIRCRLASFAYIARFEWVLDTIEREGYCLRPEYSERKSLGAKYRIGLLTLSSIVHSRSKHSIRQSALS